MKEERGSSSNEMVSPSPPVCYYQPPVPFAQRVAWSKLSKFKPKFMRFLDVPRIYVNAPFLKVFKEAPTYLKFLSAFVQEKPA